MKKIILISAIAATGLFADMMTDMATDAAMSKAKTEARSQAVKHIAGDDAMKKDLVNKGADQVLGKEDPVDKMKSDALGSVMGSGTSVPDVGGMIGGAKKETSLQDQAMGMATDQVMGTESSVDKMKSDALDSVVGSNASVPDVGTMIGGETKETSLQDQAMDMAVEKAVGTDPLKKAAAKEAVKSAL